jgi:hypothetical protein
MSHIYLDHFNFQVNGETKRATYVIKDVDERKREREEKKTENRSILGHSHVDICMNNWYIHTQ